MDENVRLIWCHSSGLDPVTYLPQWHSGGGGKDKAVTHDGSAPCRTTVVACENLLMFKSIHVTAKPKKEATELLHQQQMKIREEVGLLMNQLVVLVMEDMEKVELLNVFFALAFTADVSSQESQTSK